MVKAHGDTKATMWAGIWSNVVNLVLNTPLAATKSPGAVVTNFYRLRLPQTNSAILFEILNPVGDVDLVMRRDALPSAGDRAPGPNARCRHR